MMISMSILIISLFFITHPFPFMMMILLISLLMALTIMMFNMEPFISFIFILMISGGIMILMLFMSSLFPNEKISFKFLFLFPFPILTLNLMFPWMPTKEILNNNMFSLLLTSHYPTYIFLCSYLFIVLISSMKISMTKKSPLLN